MRLAIICAVLLAACQSPAPPGAGEPVGETTTETALSTIPDLFLGSWDEDAATCRDPTSMSRFTVTPDGIDWFGGTGDVTAVRDVGSGRTLEVDLEYVAEGSPTGKEPITTTLRLDDADRLSLSLGGGRDNLVSCGDVAGPTSTGDMEGA